MSVQWPTQTTRPPCCAPQPRPSDPIPAGHWSDGDVRSDACPRDSQHASPSSRGTRDRLRGRHCRVAATTIHRPCPHCGGSSCDGGIQEWPVSRHELAPTLPPSVIKAYHGGVLQSRLSGCQLRACCGRGSCCAGLCHRGQQLLLTLRAQCALVHGWRQVADQVEEVVVMEQGLRGAGVWETQAGETAGQARMLGRSGACRESQGGWYLTNINRRHSRAGENVGMVFEHVGQFIFCLSQGFVAWRWPTWILVHIYEGPYVHTGADMKVLIQMKSHDVYKTCGDDDRRSPVSNVRVTAALRYSRLRVRPGGGPQQRLHRPAGQGQA